MSLEMYQFSLDTAGGAVVFGDGTGYRVTELGGVFDFEEPSYLRDRGAGVWGSAYSRRVPKHRVLSATVVVKSSEVGGLVDTLRRVSLQPSLFKIRVPEIADGLEVQSNAFLDISGVLNYRNLLGYVELGLKFSLPDPRFLGVTLNSVELDSSGVTRPIFSAGNAPAEWYVEKTDQASVLDRPDGLELWLVDVDTGVGTDFMLWEANTVLFNSKMFGIDSASRSARFWPNVLEFEEGSRYSLIPSSSWRMVWPGNQQVRFWNSAGAEFQPATFFWRDAWI